MRSAFLAGWMALGLARPVSGQTDPVSTRVDRWVTDQIAARHIPGLALAVMRDGKVVHAKGFGFANVELRVPVTPETVFQSGSVGKQFTATLVMMLVEEGKIRLDESIRTYLPDAPESWQPITIRHLLTHTSGLGDYPENMDYRRDYTEDDLLKLVYGTPLEFAPGQSWRYSNLAYVTLGVTIHRITGRFYGDLLAERIFRPLGMTTARIISESDIVPNRAAGYILKDGKLANQEWVSPSLNTTADGALYFTVLDLARWDAALYTERLLERTSLEEMWTPVRLADGTTRPYGFGWAVKSANGHRLIEHSGGWQGFLTHIARYVDDRLTVVVLANLAAPATKPSEIAHRVAAMYLPAVAVP